MRNVKFERNMWTHNESLYLVMGVKLLGKGSWSKIKDRFKDQLAARNSVQLKDKYRNLERVTSELRMLETQADAFIKKLKREEQDSDDDED